MPFGENAIRTVLAEFLRGDQAHVSIEDAIKDLPLELAGRKPEGAPHSAWQLLEHIRTTLHDLLDFCLNPDYSAPQWPDDYWPKTDAPASEDAWEQSVDALKSDLEEFEKLLKSADTDLFAKIPWGDGQTILREALLAIDHTSYHAGQLVMVRKQLGAWEN